jgi:hypothetical protein
LAFVARSDNEAGSGPTPVLRWGLGGWGVFSYRKGNTDKRWRQEGICLSQERNQVFLYPSQLWDKEGFQNFVCHFAVKKPGFLVWVKPETRFFVTKVNYGAKKVSKALCVTLQ